MASSPHYDVTGAKLRFNWRPIGIFNFNMRNTTKTTVCVVSWLLLLVTSELDAALIAEWQFNSYSSGGNLSLTAEYGTQAGAAAASATAGSKNTFSTIAGTTLNQFASSSPNNAIQMATTSGSPDNAVLTLSLSGTGLSSFILTYASADNVANPASSKYTQTWAYSINGSAFTNFATINATNTSFTVYQVDFSSVASLNGAASVSFRNTINWEGDNNASVWFDNIAINAVPEPINLALAAFGVCGGGMVIGRRVLRRSRK